MGFAEWTLIMIICVTYMCLFEFFKGFIEGLNAGRKRLRNEKRMTESVREMSFRLARADRNHRRQLAEARRKRNLTQADVARRLGVSPEWVRRIEKYDSDPRISDLRRYQCAIYAEES